MSELEISIGNRLGEIARVIAQLERLAAARNIPQSAIWPLNVALDEVLSNIINYGYADDAEHRIRVRLTVARDFVVAEVEDDGIAFDPLSAPQPRLDTDVAQRPIGGLGIHIVRNLMHELGYARIAGRNRLTLKRWLAPRREGGRMELSETVTQGVTVLEVAGRIDSLTAPDFEARLTAVMNTARLVLDFRGLLYISSAGFRVLYRAAQKAKAANGKLVICGLSDQVRELFDITGFNQLFTFVGSRDDGIAALG